MISGTTSLTHHITATFDGCGWLCSSRRSSPIKVPSRGQQGGVWAWAWNTAEEMSWIAALAKERKKACNMHGRCAHKTVFFFFCFVVFAGLLACLCVFYSLYMCLKWPWLLACWLYPHRDFLASRRSSCPVVVGTEAGLSPSCSKSRLPPLVAVPP